MLWINMAIGMSVYVTVVGLFLWSFATIAWAIKKNREESSGQTNDRIRSGV